MTAPDQSKAGHELLGLWITVIVEALMLIAVGAYNIYEIRRNSELVQAKIQGLADFSARQGEKVDRMMTAMELYLGRKFAADGDGATNGPAASQRIDKAIEFLETLRKKEGMAQDRPAGDSRP